MSEVFSKLRRAGLIEKVKVNKETPCNEDILSIEECEEFKVILQKLLDVNMVRIISQREVEVSMVQDSGTMVPKPLVIQFTKNVSPTVPNVPKATTIQVPSPFPYKEDKAVPWIYDAKVQVEGNNAQQCLPTVTNIVGIGGMTRSGRIYAPDKEPVKEPGKEAAKDQEKDKSKEKEVVVEKESTGKGDKKEVSREEVAEFLKFIQQSEYKVIDQLNRTPARVSLLALLMHSESHRKVLMKILNEAHVSQNITLNQFGDLVGNITACNYLYFNDEEMPAEGRGHNKALHISVQCKEYLMAKVLVDNGSSLNVMPKSTLDKLPIDQTHMKPSSVLVRAFDGSKSEVMGEIELPIQIGPFTFAINFQVMNIKPSYSCLLGRPWIHSAGVVPSTLHQKLKFVVDDKLIIESGEEDMLVSKPTSTRYIEAAEEALGTSFQALEIVDSAYVGFTAKEPCLSNTALMVGSVMLNGGYQPGKGLGKNQEGIASILRVPENKDRYGLGYVPTKVDRERMVEERKEKRKARLENREPKLGKISICDLRQSFQSAGWIYPDQVAAVGDDLAVPDEGWVRPCSSMPCNWEIVESPRTFNAFSM